MKATERFTVRLQHVAAKDCGYARNWNSMKKQEAADAALTDMPVEMSILDLRLSVSKEVCVETSMTSTDTETLVRKRKDMLFGVAGVVALNDEDVILKAVLKSHTRRVRKELMLSV